MGKWTFTINALISAGVIITWSGLQYFVGMTVIGALMGVAMYATGTPFPKIERFGK